MSTTYTQSDLATRVLRDLGLIGAEEVPSAFDYDFTVQSIEADIATMAAIGLPIWNGSEIEIPQNYLTPLSKRIGLSVAPAFGLMGTVEAEAAKPALERTLTILANPQGGSPQAARTDDATGSGRRFNWLTGI